MRLLLLPGPQKFKKEDPFLLKMIVTDLSVMKGNDCNREEEKE